MLLPKPVIKPCHRKNPDGSVRENWLVYCGTDAGRSVKFYRSTEREAKELACSMEKKVRRVGAAASILDAAQIYDASEALLLLSEAGAPITLTECARMWLERNGEALRLKQCSVEDAIRDYLLRFDQEKEHCGTVRRLISRFADEFGKYRPMTDITRSDFERFLSLYPNPKSYNLNRGYFLAWLNWCKKNGRYTSAKFDECKCVEKRREPYKPPCFFDADTVEKVMRWAEKQPDADMLIGRLAISFFAGIRTEEIARMDWEHIHFEEGEIRVECPKGVDGTPPRIVSMSKNLRSWLLTCKKASGKISYSDSYFSERKEKMKSEIGVEWDDAVNRNVARHTFATMHGAFHKSYELLASEMGHSANSSMLIKRYKNIVRGSVAAAFWNIYPSQQSAGSELTG